MINEFIYTASLEAPMKYGNNFSWMGMSYWSMATEKHISASIWEGNAF